MSSRSGGRTSEDDTDKTSRSRSRHSSSSSSRKRRYESPSRSDESKVKHRKYNEYPSNRSSESQHYRKEQHDRNNSHRGSQRNNSHSSNSFRRPRSRSRSHEKRRTPDKYTNKDRGSKRRSPDRGRDRYYERDFGGRYNVRLNERDSTSSVHLKTIERGKSSASENFGSKEEEDLLSKNPTSSLCLENLVKPGVPGATKLVEEVEKRKLLFSKKEKPVEQSSSVWDRTKFSQDSDGKMTAKFKRLMGIKDEGPGSIPDEKPQKATKQEEYFADLEKQYEVARVTTHTQRGVGFGFSSSRIFPLKPKP